MIKLDVGKFEDEKSEVWKFRFKIENTVRNWKRLKFEFENLGFFENRFQIDVRPIGRISSGFL